MKYGIGSVQLMQEKGGSFASTLAKLWFEANLSDRLKLEEAFGHYFELYEDQYKYLQQEEGWAPDSIEMEEGGISSIFN